MFLCSIHVQSECNLISQQHQQHPRDLLHAPCSKVINDNLCESRCMVESQARGSGQQREVRTVDQRRPRCEVAAPLMKNIACLCVACALNTARY